MAFMFLAQARKRMIKTKQRNVHRGMRFSSYGLLGNWTKRAETGFALRKREIATDGAYVCNKKVIACGWSQDKHNVLWWFAFVFPHQFIRDVVALFVFSYCIRQRLMTLESKKHIKFIT